VASTCLTCASGARADRISNCPRPPDVDRVGGDPPRRTPPRRELIKDGSRPFLLPVLTAAAAYWSTLTARATTSAVVDRAMIDWNDIRALAHLLSGMVSVGEKANPLVRLT